MKKLLLCFLLVVAVPAVAGTIDIGYPVQSPGGSNIGAIAYYQWLAEEFTISSPSDITSVFVGIDGFLGDTYNLSIADGLGTGTTFWSGSGTGYDPKFTTSFSLDPGTYFLIASSLGIVAGWENSNYGLVQNGGTAVGIWWSGDLGASWHPNSGYSPWFEIQGTTGVPEPSSLLLLGSGLLGLGGIVRWKLHR